MRASNLEQTPGPTYLEKSARRTLCTCPGLARSSGKWAPGPGPAASGRKGSLPGPRSQNSSQQPQGNQVRPYGRPGIWKKNSKLGRPWGGSGWLRVWENPDSHAAGLPSQLDCPPRLPSTCCSDLWAVAFQAFAFQKELENIPEQLNIAPVKLFHLHAYVHSTNTLRGPAHCQMRADPRLGRSKARKAVPDLGAGAGA